MDNWREYLLGAVYVTLPVWLILAYKFGEWAAEVRWELRRRRLQKREGAERD
jgi:hypothetical protein